MARAGTPLRRELQDKSLDQNLHRLLGEEQKYPPDVVEDDDIAKKSGSSSLTPRFLAVRAGDTTEFSVVKPSH